MNKVIFFGKISITAFCLLAFNSFALANAATELPHKNVFLSTEDGIYKVSESGEYKKLSQLERSYGLEVCQDALYVTWGPKGQSIKKYTLDGKFIDETPIPFEAIEYINFKCLPNSRIALLNNVEDEVNIIDLKGTLIKTVSMGTKKDKHWQDLDAVVVGDSLYVAEVGESQVLRIQLDTFQTSIFKNLKSQLFAISSITYSPHTGLFYATDQDRGLYSFNDTQDVKMVTKKYIGGWYGDIEVVYPFVYIAQSQGRVVVFNLETQEFKELCNLSLKTRAISLD